MVKLLAMAHAQVRIYLLITAKNVIFESILGLNTFRIRLREPSYIFSGRTRRAASTELGLSKGTLDGENSFAKFYFSILCSMED